MLGRKKNLYKCKNVLVTSLRGKTVEAGKWREGQRVRGSFVECGMYGAQEAETTTRQTERKDVK